MGGPREIEIYFAGRGMRVLMTTPVLLGMPGMLLIAYSVARLALGDASDADKLLGLTTGVPICCTGLMMTAGFIRAAVPFRAWISIDERGLTIHHSRAFKKAARVSKDDVDVVVVESSPGRDLAEASRLGGKQWQPPGALTMELPNVLIRLRRRWKPENARWTLRRQSTDGFGALWLTVRSPEAAVKAFDGWNLTETVPPDVTDLARHRTTWRATLAAISVTILYLAGFVILSAVLGRNGIR